MNTLEQLMEEFGFTDDEISYALDKAKGIILGFAMEYRARQVLESMNFINVKSVDLPTHDIEAEKDGRRYFIEVKATKKSPTKEYSAYKIAMIAKLGGTHLTLLMTPKPTLYLTEDILSEPKRILLKFFRLIFAEDLVDLKDFLDNDKNRKIVTSYEKVISSYLDKIPNENLLDIVKSVF
ncbi:hypothetical protein [Acidianus brierleyi]|uniref:Endonuclease n=1 Tax=Acidianus brierleyi TaxID=41673 RepID=A0A2U9IBE1_9CREN|nr:hypothetical protein [Acidianus brierleyi]AWR93325.1 hypothetical protein DFR85_00590 [Acidianus brierleyi]